MTKIEKLSPEAPGKNQSGTSYGEDAPDLDYTLKKSGETGRVHGFNLYSL
jgi:hypothetical protein